MASTSLGRVLIVAGSDSGGGAGVQADIKTVTMLGGYAASAITAITVQNTLGVSAVRRLTPELVLAQARAVLDDIGADAIKTGMLGGRRMVEAVAALLDEDAQRVVRLVATPQGLHAEAFGVVRFPLKLHWVGHDHTYACHDLAADPGERSPLPSERCAPLFPVLDATFGARSRGAP